MSATIAESRRTGAAKALERQNAARVAAVPAAWATEVAPRILCVVRSPGGAAAAEAVELSQPRAIAMPTAVVVQTRQAVPARPGGIAHGLLHQSILVGDLRLPPGLLPAVGSSTLVITDQNSLPVLRTAARAVANGLAYGRLVVLDGQTHDIDPAATAAVIEALIDGRA